MAKDNPLIKLKKDLKEGNLKNLYVFYGEEEYLKDLYTKRILNTIADDGFEEFNKIIIDGKTASLEEINDALSSFPVMCDKKVVLIKNSGIFKSADESKKDFYRKAFSSLSQDTVLVFSESEIDKRGELYKTASKSGEVIEFALLDDADLVAFVQREVMGFGCKIQKDCAEYMVGVCDASLMALKNEILKLVSAVKNGEITKTDIDSVVSKSLQIQVFELCDLLVQKDADGVYKMISDLKTVKESPFKLLAILFGTFDKILKAKLMQGEGMSYNEIIGELSVPPFIAKKYINIAKSFSEDELILMVASLASTDLLIKQGKTDEWTAFENYINKFLSYGKEN